MRPLILDPTAGDRARHIRLNPDSPERIPDPTDPRWGEFAPGVESRPGNTAWIVDPTDPACGTARADR